MTIFDNVNQILSTFQLTHDHATDAKYVIDVVVQPAKCRFAIPTRSS